MGTPSGNPRLYGSNHSNPGSPGEHRYNRNRNSELRRTPRLEGSGVGLRLDNDVLEEAAEIVSPFSAVTRKK